MRAFFFNDHHCVKLKYFATRGPGGPRKINRFTPPAGAISGENGSMAAVWWSLGVFSEEEWKCRGSHEKMRCSIRQVVPPNSSHSDSPDLSLGGNQDQLEFNMWQKAYEKLMIEFRIANRLKVGVPPFSNS